MRLDLGCGSRKNPGYYGLDRLPCDGVDQVCDLNDGLPFPDNSADGIMASRVLPYVDNLAEVLSEIYRVCTHGAIVCILAPYAHHFAHMSNPCFKHKFDEYTPRYLTRSFTQPPDGLAVPELREYPPPPPPYDFRLLRMELICCAPFAPPFFELEEVEVLKQLQANVVYEVLYHFIAVKRPVSAAELERAARGELPEPVSLVRGVF